MSDRKKVIVEYDESTGQICDAIGTPIFTWPGLQHFGEAQDSGVSVRDVIKLKEGGFSAEEIVTMRDGGVL